MINLLIEKLIGMVKGKNKQKRKGNKGKAIRRPRLAPNSKSFQTRNTNPMRRLRFKHTEYVRDIFGGNSNWEHAIMAVNPGDSDILAWLCNLAANFETYKWHSLSFSFLPMLGTTTAGKILLAPDYDAADDNTGVTKQEMNTFQDAASGSVWDKVVMRCTPSNLHKQKEYYVRTGVLASNLDIKMYDVLSLNIGVIGTSALASNTLLGELYVHYDVEFFTPQRNPGDLVGACKIFNSAPPSVGSPFVGDVTRTNVGDELAVTVHDLNSLRFSEPGKYTVSLTGEGDTFSGYNTPTMSGGSTIQTLNQAFDVNSYAGTYVVDIIDTARTIQQLLNWTGTAGVSASAYNTLITKAPRLLTI